MITESAHLQGDLCPLKAIKLDEITFGNLEFLILIKRQRTTRRSYVFIQRQIPTDWQSLFCCQKGGLGDKFIKIKIII